MDYEAALKKLINILKFKHTDGLKQIEDLWDTINLTSPSSSSSGKLIKDENNKNDDINGGKSNNIKRTASDLQTINNKKPKLSSTGLVVNNTVKKNIKSSNDLVLAMNSNGHEYSNNNNNDNNTNNKKSDHNPQQQQQQMRMLHDVSIKFDNNIEDDSVIMMKIDDCDESKSNSMASCSSGSNSNGSYGSNELQHNTSNIDDYAIDMGLTCDICLTLTQEQNNKLAECQECKRLYHQLCHKPTITNEEIQDPRKLWYCSKCIKNIKKFGNGCNGKTNGKLIVDKQSNHNNIHINNNNSKIESHNSINNVNNNINANDESLSTKSMYKRQNSNENSTQQQSTIVNGKDNENNHIQSSNDQSFISHNNEQKLFFKRDPKTTTSVVTNEKLNVDNTNNKTVKGLAALATKFNSNSNTTLNTSPEKNNLNNNKNSLITSKQQYFQQINKKLKPTTTPSFNISQNNLKPLHLLRNSATTVTTTTNSNNNNNSTTNLGLTSPIAEKKNNIV